MCLRVRARVFVCVGAGSLGCRLLLLQQPRLNSPLTSIDYSSTGGLANFLFPFADAVGELFYKARPEEGDE